MLQAGRVVSIAALGLLALWLPDGRAAEDGSSYPSKPPALLFTVPHYCEGVAFDHDGFGYLSEGENIVRFTLGGEHEVWATTGAPNGHKVLADSTHLVCDGKQRAVLRLSATGEVLGKASSECRGTPLRGPNDLTLDTAAGGFYFTDPGGSNKERPIGTVHHVDAGGKTTLIDEGLAFPNGIVLTPDGKTLYVGESQHNRILAYDVRSPGRVGPRKVFAQLPDKDPAAGQIDNQPDGMCLDAKGNLYVAHYGMRQVQVLDPQGNLIARLHGGNLTTSNVAFGGPRHDQLFITGSLEGGRSEGGLFRHDLGVKGLVILPPRAASAQIVPNSSFEAGEKAPESWSLQGGAGEWIEGGADGRRAVSVTGSGRPGDSSYWRSDAIDLEPFSLYRLRFQARRIAGGGDGCAITGPVFCNRDLRGLPDDWCEFTSIFFTPSEMERGESWLRFGQWHLGGTVAYDAVEVLPVQAVYRSAGGLVLGDGEAVRGREYIFNAPLATGSFNHARPLVRLRCGYNAPRYTLGGGSEIVYRHRAGDVPQTSARIEVNVGYHTSGELAVEVSQGGDAWKEVGSISGVETRSFDPPVDLFPSRDVLVRLRARSRRRDGGSEQPASLQVHGYSYRAMLERAPGDLRGATRFIAITESDPRVGVSIESIGEGIPGGENVVVARVVNRTEKSVEIQPRISLFYQASPKYRGVMSGGGLSRKLPPGQETLRIPYEIPAAGTVDVWLRLGGDVRFRAETSIEVPALYESCYGVRLPSPDDSVALWWASSGWKISRRRPAPAGPVESSLRISAAKGETEAAQLAIRPERKLAGVSLRAGDLSGPADARIPADRVEILRVGYVDVERPTDRVGVAAPWPDPLPPLRGAIDIEAGENQPFWVRVRVPRGVPAGVYRGDIRIEAAGFTATAPLQLTVFDFALPERMTCTTCFGFSHGLAFRYHGVSEPADRRRVYESYLETLGAHHISPYDPAALDPVRVTWPDRDKSRAPTAPELTPQFDWRAWDEAMARAIDHYRFNSFRLSIPGLGGGTFHSRTEPSLLGYGEDAPEYKMAFTAYCQSVEKHLSEKGWLDEAFVYWFDEPDPKDYAFVMNGFRKLKEAAPDLRRMLTEQVEPELIGGPNIWCVLTPAFDPEVARVRRAAGEESWWYVCTGPKEPYATLFIDHPGTEMRVWLWQTWKRRIRGVLVWQTNYWTSSAAYPDPKNPQNPYADPMGWTSGYSTPAGAKRPWGNGDGRFVYPPEAAADGNPPEPVLDPPVDSIRLEMLRDGIEDYEYLAMLERLVEEKTAKLGDDEEAEFRSFLEVPDAVSIDLTHFTKDPAPIEARREEVARAIERILRR
ncbi:MAG: SMP-30/gluconolactonase/LRE family protein [Planctomycetes bacterium]|nr:SMP-30/gluconolactonase/LRE family protein [Planctomycetota bacterium]